MLPASLKKNHVSISGPVALPALLTPKMAPSLDKLQSLKLKTLKKIHRRVRKREQLLGIAAQFELAVANINPDPILPVEEEHGDDPPKYENIMNCHNSRR